MLSISHVVYFPYLFVASAEKQMKTKIPLKKSILTKAAQM